MAYVARPPPTSYTLPQRSPAKVLISVPQASRFSLIASESYLDGIRLSAGTDQVLLIDKVVGKSVERSSGVFVV